MFNQIDLSVLDRIFEPAAAWIHKRLGISNYALAKWLLYFGTASFVLLAITEQAEGRGGLVALFEVIYAWPAMSLAARLDDTWKGDTLPPNLRDSPRGTSEYEIVWRRKRALFLPVLAVFVITVFMPILLGMVSPEVDPYDQDYSFWVSYGIAWLPVVSGFYFLSCIPRPPRKQEMRMPAHGQLSPARIK